MTKDTAKVTHSLLMALHIRVRTSSIRLKALAVSAGPMATTTRACSVMEWCKDVVNSKTQQESLSKDNLNATTDLK